MSSTTTQTTSVMRRPFYLRPPWNVLFELSKLEKLTPWNVNIAYLLRTFLAEWRSMWVLRRWTSVHQL
jgi:hypothetical protein